jgi:GT2 family glycosyltransferase
MKRDLVPVLESAVRTDCAEILLIGDEGKSPPDHVALDDPRVRVIGGPPDLAGKRNQALREAAGSVVAYIDDDALIPDGWFEALKAGFRDDAVGVVSGPSILPSDATYWERVAQLVMQSTQYTRRRYTFCQKGDAAWWDVIGANFAFRRAAMLELGGCPTQFLAVGDDMAMAWQMENAGWKIYYDPRAYVYHRPHGFRDQLCQIFRFGKAAKRLQRAGIEYPERDTAYLWLAPVFVMFAAVYMLGMIKESLLGKPPVGRTEADADDNATADADADPASASGQCSAAA